VASQKKPAYLDIIIFETLQNGIQWKIPNTEQLSIKKVKLPA